jgi:CDP-2,3-bis-(O-geranylgeranyl)-sn-glycerol synthase
LEAEKGMSGESAVSQVLSAVWFILPAYLANGGALVLGGGMPLDLGRKLGDGRRILGDGVTIRGTLGGIVVGLLVGLLQKLSIDPYFGALLGFLLGTGAMFGDALGSLVKRRLGVGRGKSAPVLDQVGFLLFALAFAALITEVLFTTIVILLILTPTLHLVTNAIAYQLGMKKVWY